MFSSVRSKSFFIVMNVSKIVKKLQHNGVCRLFSVILKPGEFPLRKNRIVSINHSDELEVSIPAAQVSYQPSEGIFTLIPLDIKIDNQSLSIISVHIVRPIQNGTRVFGSLARNAINSSTKKLWSWNYPVFSHFEAEDYYSSSTVLLNQQYSRAIHSFLQDAVIL